MKTPKPQPSDRDRTLAVCRMILSDDAASYTERLKAGEMLDALLHGRPGVNRQIELDDLKDLSDRDFERLFYAVMRRADATVPDFLKKLIRAQAESLLAEHDLALPKPEAKFVRGRNAKPAIPIRRRPIRPTVSRNGRPIARHRADPLLLPPPVLPGARQMPGTPIRLCHHRQPKSTPHASAPRSPG
jgi:hypothetical protein